MLAAISLIGAGVRHWFNLRGMGHVNTWLLPAAAVGMVALAYVSHGPRTPTPVSEAPPFEEIERIVQERCVTCHADKPTFAAYAEAPLGLSLETPESIRANAAKIHTQVVATPIMPLGNLTQMTAEERATLGKWIDAGAPLP